MKQITKPNLHNAAKMLLLPALLFLCVFCTVHSPVLAASEEPFPIRVGFFSFDGYHMQDANGVRSGYGYDFLQRAARYENITFEYVGYDCSWQEMLKMLENGQIDLLTSIRKTPEREELFLFSDKDIGYSSTLMTVKEGDERITAGDYATYDGISVAMLRGNSRNDSFADFAKEHGFSYQPVYYETDTGLHLALQEGIVQAAVTSSLRVLRSERIIESFHETPFYAAVRKDDTETISYINDAIDEMDRCEPGWRQELYQTYYNADTNAANGADANGGTNANASADASGSANANNGTNANANADAEKGIAAGSNADAVTGADADAGTDNGTAAGIGTDTDNGTNTTANAFSAGSTNPKRTHETLPPWFGILLLLCIFCIAFLSVRLIRFRSLYHQAQAALAAAQQTKSDEEAQLAQFSQKTRAGLKGLLGTIEIAQMHIDEPEYLKSCLEKMSTTAKHLLSLFHD